MKRETSITFKENSSIFAPKMVDLCPQNVSSLFPKYFIFVLKIYSIFSLPIWYSLQWGKWGKIPLVLICVPCLFLCWERSQPWQPGKLRKVRFFVPCGLRKRCYFSRFQWFWPGTTKKALFWHIFSILTMKGPKMWQKSFITWKYDGKTPLEKNWGSFVHRGLSNTF